MNRCENSKEMLTDRRLVRSEHRLELPATESPVDHGKHVVTMNSV